MNAARPTERDLHALIDERLDKARARELSSWLADGALHDERLASWKRGVDALRAVYDPVVDEAPPLFLSLAARAAAAGPRDDLAHALEADAASGKPAGSFKPAGPLATSSTGRIGPSRPVRLSADMTQAYRPRRSIAPILASFVAGALCAVLLPAVIRQVLDPAQPSIFAGVLRVVAQITGLIGRMTGWGT